MQIQTNDGEVVGQTDLGLGRDLTLVNPGIMDLGRCDFEGPLVGSIAVQRLKSLVVRVGQYTNCQYVQVTFPYPRNLRSYINE